MVALQNILYTFVIISFACYLIPCEATNCNICQENGVACINDTAYHFCFGSNNPNTQQIFNCADGFVCTDLPTICFQRSERPASCDDTDSCGLCNSSLVFACTSRTTFAFCFGGLQPTDVTGTCPFGKVCDASAQEICVDTVQSNSIICNEDSPTN